MCSIASPLPPASVSINAPIAPIDVGFVVGIGAAANLYLGPGGGVEVVYDLYDFEVDTFVYGGFAAGFGASLTGYLGVVSGWSYYDDINHDGVDNYRGPFGSFGGGAGLVSGQMFFGAPSNPTDRASGRLVGGSIGGGPSWGIKGLELPGSATGGGMWYITIGDVFEGIGLGPQSTKLTFHQQGFHRQTEHDAHAFAAYIAKTAPGLAALMIPIVYYNGRAWQTQQ